MEFSPRLLPQGVGVARDKGRGGGEVEAGRQTQYLKAELDWVKLEVEKALWLRPKLDPNQASKRLISVSDPNQPEHGSLSG